MSYQPGVYKKQGGNKLVAKAGVGRIQFGEDFDIDDTVVCIGGGSAANPVASASTSKNFLDFRFSHTGASGDIRGLYLRTYYAGGAGGESARIFSTIQANCGTARGAHISLNFDGGFCSGLATALSGTLHIPNTGAVTGNIAAIEAQAYCDAGDDDDVTVPTEHGLIRCTISGDSGNVASFINILHVDVAAGCVGNKAAKLAVCNADVTGGGGAASGGLHVRVEGTNYWIPLYAE